MIEETYLGTDRNGAEVYLYALRNQRGMVARIMTYGARLTELHVPDRHGNLADVVLGFDELAGYLAENPYFGATVGRVANRTASAAFTLDRQMYVLARNDGPHHLHGGVHALDRRIWSARPVEAKAGPALELRYLSPDGEEGYPGNLDITVVYTLTHEGALTIDYTAVTDRATPVNLTHHSYFNLSGAGRGNILAHELTIAAAHYTPVDATLIPTGQIAPVAGTPFDFREPMPLGLRMHEAGGKVPGYDINFVLDSQDGALALAATLHDPASGRVMEVHTTAPGMQLYDGIHLDGSLVGKGGMPYVQYSGLCLEAQHFPNAMNEPRFPSIVLEPGQTYRQTTVYAFRAS